MIITYLGTGAAEGIPALFCNCFLCQKAKALGGKNIRSRSQALINDDLLIDFGPDAFWHMCRYGLDLAKVRTLLITHAHEDHYTPSELCYRKKPFAYLSGDKEADNYNFPTLDIWMSQGSFEYEGVRFLHRQELADGKAPMTYHTAKAFEPFTAGRYTVTPLTANHAPGFEALIYIISDGQSAMLYGHDTGLFPEETVEYLSRVKPRLDLVSLDCTGMASGHNSGGGMHMNLERNLITREVLNICSCTDGTTVWCCNHFSHNGKSTHEELVDIMGKENFLVAYDGMEITF